MFALSSSPGMCAIRCGAAAVLLILLGAASIRMPAQAAAGTATVSVSADPRVWHKVTITVNGPEASETGTPNPFLDYRMTVAFAHESGSPRYTVPGYFAADGDAANTGATSGNRWRAHLSPDKPGRWSYRIAFVQGSNIAVAADAGSPVAGVDGTAGSFQVKVSNKTAPDFRAHGRLQYVGKHHLQFAGSREYFLKAGADSPETFLGYSEFDGTYTNKVPLKTYAPHLNDFRPGNPTWKGTDGAPRGKGIIGAINYLASQGMNALSFMPYNGGGDGQNVWPFVKHDDQRHYDVSKLDQWQIVLEHAQSRGLYLHFKLQEQENDDNRTGHEATPGSVPASLNDGKLGLERKLYLRELIARFGYLLALNWNLGEENTQSTEEQMAMANYIRDTDPYKHHIVVHTFPDWQERVYPPLLGKQSPFTGASLQNAFDATHERTYRWLKASAEAGKPWVVANDEQGTANLGVPPDPGYQGFNGKGPKGEDIRSIHDIRKYTLWGNLMAGGAGVEYYFGYQLPQNDLVMEDFRSRARSWEYARHALTLFREQKIPFWEMQNQDERVSNDARNNSRYCLAKPGSVYLVYLPTGGATELDLTGVPGNFSVTWLNPRTGAAGLKGSVTKVGGGAKVSLGNPPSEAGEDWAVLVRKP